MSRHHPSSRTTAATGSPHPRGWRHRLPAAAVLVLPACLLLCHCGEQPEESAETRDFTTSSGPVAATLTPAATTLSTAETLRLRLLVEHPAESSLTLPEQSATWGDFTILETHDLPPTLDGDGRISLVRTYVLEPDLPGTHTLPPLALSPQLSTAAIPLEITSALMEGETKLRPIASAGGTVEKEREPTWFLPVAVLAFLAAVSALRLWKSRKHLGTTPATGPEREFQALEDAAPAEVMARLEPAAARLLAARHGIRLPAADFQSLLAGLDTPPPGLAAAIATYERLQYSAATPTAAEARALHQTFRKLAGATPDPAPASGETISA